MTGKVIHMAHFSIPAHVLLGSNALGEAGKLIRELGKKALIVTGPHVGKSPMVEELKETLTRLGLAYSIYDEISGEPTDRMVEEGVKRYREADCDFLIGIGGGSPLDSAKAIAAMSVSEGKIADYMGEEIDGDLPPVVAIPTTAGTGSEATKFTVITDTETGVKMLLKGEALIPKIAILNPEYTMDMPKAVTAATGMDALTHAIEAYTSGRASELTDVFAVSAVGRIFTCLPLAYKNGFDAKARAEMQLAAYEAGVCINNSSVTIVHGMSRPIGALFHVPHGMSNAMLLEGALGFVLDGAYERFGRLARETGFAGWEESDEMASKKLMEAIAELCIELAIPSLKEYGIDEKEYMKAIDKMATDAIASGSPGNAIKTVTKEDCMRIYRAVFD